MNVHDEREIASEAVRMIGAMIRQESKEGRLVSAPEVLNWAAEQKLFTPSGAGEEAGVNLLCTVVDENEDLRHIADENDFRSYYSSLSMTEAYARILLHKGSAPLRLIADVVRENSCSISSTRAVGPVHPASLRP